MKNSYTPARAIVFVDGQNLFHSAQRAFGITYPNYNVTALAEALCKQQGWKLTQIRFYTGIPSINDNEHWHNFWKKKLLHMTRQGTYVYSRLLQYRKREVVLDNGAKNSVLIGEEKGIDVRIAVDVIRLGHKNEYDVALILSQDQDLSEVADEIRVIAREQRRWIKVASAFPFSSTVNNKRGINKTDWIHIDGSTYQSCVEKMSS